MTRVKTFTDILFTCVILLNSVCLQAATTYRNPVGSIQGTQDQDEQESFAKSDEEWDSQTTERLPLLSGFVRAQESAVISELERIRTALGLPVSFIRDASKAVWESTKEFGQELKTQSSDYPQLRFNSQIHPKLAARLYIQARDFVPKERRNDYDTLIADNKSLKVLNDHYSQQGLISYLDTVLRLNQRQKSELKELLSANWDHHWNSLVSMTTFNSISFSKPIVDSLPESEVASILSAEQMDVYQKFQNFEPGNVLVNIIKDVRAGAWDDQEFKETCWTILNLEIQRLEQLSPLSDNDRRLLQIAGKGCIQQLRHTWVRQIESDRSNGQAAHAGIDAYHRTMNDFLTNNDIWKGAVAKILTAQQLDSLKQLESDQAKATQEEIYQHAANVISQASGIPLTLHQHEDLVVAFKKHSQPFEPNTIRRRHYKLPFTLSDEKFQEVIPDRTWTRIEGLIKRFRKDIETLK